MANWRKVAKRRKMLKAGRKRLGLSGFSSLNRSRKIVVMAKLAFMAVLIFFVGSFLLLPVFAFNLPNPDSVVRKEGFSTKIMDRNGEVLYDIFVDQKRTPVEFENIPDYLKQATIAIEDKNFYQHQGFDPLGMVRGFSRIFTRGFAQGGSTLTQQLVKNVLLTPERSVWRKIKEFVLAVQIERKYSKDDILRMYLNEAPYGGTSWGVGAASEAYFGKDVKDLNLVESAFMAGLPQRPSTYSPYSGFPDAYIERTRHVLRRMEEDGYINKEQRELAIEQLEELEFVGRGSNFKAPHFVQYVQRILEERYGERVVEQGGLRVTTTIDLDLQNKAQAIVAEEIAKVENLHITNGAAVVINPETSEVLAMVGSKDFNASDYDGQVNVVLALRQPGSAIKPVTYAAGLKKKYTPATLIMDVPTSFPIDGMPDYKPVNYDGKFRGPIQLRYALANSINITAVKMLAMVGVRDMLQTAYDLGITSLEPTRENLRRFGLAVTLGGGEVRLLELTAAYGAFANQGHRVEPLSILRVEDQNGRVLENNTPRKGRRVLTPEEAYLMADILSDNEARTPVFGANSLLNIPGRQVLVKTGTTNDRRDNWTVGGNQQAMVGVWVGNNDNSPMRSVASGVTGASPIWRRVLLASLDGKPNVGFETPGGIVTAAVDTVSGLAVHHGFPSRIEKFIDGTQPGEDTIHVKLRVCKSDGGLATPSDISSGNYEEREFYVFREEDPVSTDGRNRWQEGIDAWLSGQGDSRYLPPKDNCRTSNPVSVDFQRPRDRDSNLSNKFTIELRAESVADIIEVTLEIDGVRVRSFNERPYRHEVELDRGIYVLKARARDREGKEAERTITVGVRVPWDYDPSPTPEPTLSPTPISTPTPIPTPVITLPI
jgi:1A family penicillin-binding protein